MNETEPQEEEPLTVMDQFIWYFIAAIIGISIILGAMALIDNEWGLVGAWIAFGAWMLCVWLLTKAGFWNWLERFFIIILRPFGLILGTIGKVLGPVWKVLGAVGTGIELTISAITFIIGSLLSFAFIVFFIVGIIGLLWFGIKQIF